MRKLFLFITALTLSVGIAQGKSMTEVVDHINNVASEAITEVKNASTEAAAKPIQDKAIADINQTKDIAIREIADFRTDPKDYEIIETWAIHDMNRIKDQALREIKGETASGETTGQLDSVYMYDDDVLIMKAYYTYNNKGELIQRHYIKDVFGWEIPFKLEVNDYSEAGLLTSRKSYDFVEDQQGEWQKVLDIETMCQYDAQGRLVRDTITDFYEEDTVVYGSTRYQYNENGNVCEIIKYESTKVRDVVVSEDITKTQVTYNANNQISQEILYLKQPDSQWSLLTTTTYTYNEKDLLVEWLEDNEDVDDAKILYTYNDNNYPITKVAYIRSVNEWELEGKEEYTYDEHNNMTMYNSFVYRDEEWIPRFKNSETYTGQGWLETDTCYVYHDDIYDLYYIDEYTYDTYGNLLLLISADYLGEELLGVDKYQYFYSYSSADLIDVNSKSLIQNSKFIHNGQLIIRKAGRDYNVLGQELR